MRPIVEAFPISGAWNYKLYRLCVAVLVVALLALGFLDEDFLRQLGYPSSVRKAISIMIEVAKRVTIIRF